MACAKKTSHEKAPLQNQPKWPPALGGAIDMGTPQAFRFALDTPAHHEGKCCSFSVTEASLVTDEKSMSREQRAGKKNNAATEETNSRQTTFCSTNSFDSRKMVWLTQLNQDTTPKETSDRKSAGGHGHVNTSGPFRGPNPWMMMWRKRCVL